MTNIEALKQQAKKFIEEEGEDSASIKGSKDNEFTLVILATIEVKVIAEGDQNYVWQQIFFNM